MYNLLFIFNDSKTTQAFMPEPESFKKFIMKIFPNSFSDNSSSLSLRQLKSITQLIIDNVLYENDLKQNSMEINSDKKVIIIKVKTNDSFIISFEKSQMAANNLFLNPVISSDKYLINNNKNYEEDFLNWLNKAKTAPIPIKVFKKPNNS